MIQFLETHVLPFNWGFFLGGGQLYCIKGMVLVKTNKGSTGLDILEVLYIYQWVL